MIKYSILSFVLKSLPSSHLKEAEDFLTTDKQVHGKNQLVSPVKRTRIVPGHYVCRTRTYKFLTILFGITNGARKTF